MEQDRTSLQQQLPFRALLVLSVDQLQEMHRSIVDVVCSKIDDTQTGQGGWAKAEAIFYVRIPAFMAEVAAGVWLPKLNEVRILQCKTEAYLLQGVPK